MRFFIYARKSTNDEGRKVLSIDSQLDELQGVCTQGIAASHA